MAQSVVSKLEVFISHSNELEDQQLVYDEVIPKLTARGINIVGQEKLRAGHLFLSSLTELLDKTEKTLLFISPNSMKSPWCDLEMLIGLERSQTKNQLSVVLLLHEITESKLPQIAVLQEAPKVYFVKGSDSWVSEAIERIREKDTIKHVMSAGNVAHGLVWSHFTGFQQYVLPVLDQKLKESDWYKRFKEPPRVSTKLYELVPKSCACQKDLGLPHVDANVQKEIIIDIGAKLRGGNERHYKVQLYKVTDGDETNFCMCNYPSVIETMRIMQDHHLAVFNADDKKLQLARFYYTMNSILSHFENTRGKARVLLFNDDTEKISHVLVKAIKEDLLLTEMFVPESGWFNPSWENLEQTKGTYEYHVHVAHAGHEEDKVRADEIVEFLEKRKIKSILKSNDHPTPGNKSNILITAVTNCRWFVFLMTKNAMKDKMLEWRVLAVLNEGISKKSVRVIPVVDRRKDIFIPEALRWVTYVPFKNDKSHLESIYNIVSGEDMPLRTDLLLPAGDVANGLAWGYVVNYLTKIIPNVLDGIEQALTEKHVVRYQCPKKLFIVIPKSCDASHALKDTTDGLNKRITNFTKTPNVYPDGDERAYSCQIYQIDGLDLYFVGQYAAPVTCLDEMRRYNIAGVTADTMATEVERFYDIVGTLMKQAAADKAKFCEFVFYDDMNANVSLADIIKEKITTTEL